jgi:hypothetical protein
MQKVIAIINGYSAANEPEHNGNEKLKMIDIRKNTKISPGYDWGYFFSKKILQR